MFYMLYKKLDFKKLLIKSKFIPIIYIAFYFYKIKVMSRTKNSFEYIHDKFSVFLTIYLECYVDQLLNR